MKGLLILVIIFGSAAVGLVPRTYAEELQSPMEFEFNYSEDSLFNGSQGVPSPTVAGVTKTVSNTASTVQAGISTVQQGVGAAQSVVNTAVNLPNAASSISSLPALANLSGLSDSLGSFGSLMQNGLGSLGFGSDAIQSASTAIGGLGDAAEKSINKLLGGVAGAATTGAGMPVLDIGNLALELVKLTGQMELTSLYSDQLSTLLNTSQVAAEGLAVTRGLLDQIGAVGNLTSQVGGIFDQLNSAASSVSSSGSLMVDTVNGQVSVASPITTIAGMAENKVNGLFDIYTAAANMAQGFTSDPVGTSVELLSMLFGGPTNHIQTMSEDAMNATDTVLLAGASTAALASALESSAASTATTVDARTRQLAQLRSALRAAKNESEIGAINAQVKLLQADIMADNLGTQESLSVLEANRSVEKQRLEALRLKELAGQYRGRFGY